MKIPNKIRIGSMDYKIIMTEEPLLLNNRACKGIIDYEMHEITLKEGIQDQQGLEQTLLHEIIHGIVFERSFEFTNNDEETIVDELAKGFHQLIKDNLELFSIKT